MSAVNKSLLGLGYRVPHYAEMLEKKPDFGFFEIISENFLNSAPRPRFFLEQLRALYPVAMHGVGLSIGSPDPLDRKYLADLKALADWLKPQFISDHLSWSSRHDHNSHDLLPLPYTQDSLERVVGRVDEVQNFLGARILLENPSAYVSFRASQMTEGEFLAELHRRTGCGVLLDLNNLYVNQHNLGLDPVRVIRELPEAALGYFHLAGHSRQGEILIDTHDHRVADAVWPLYREAVKRWPKVQTLLEWDGKIPAFTELCEELAQVGREREKALELLVVQERVAAPAVSGAVTPVQDRFFNYIVDPARDEADFSVLAGDLVSGLTAPAAQGAHVYQNAYHARFVEVFADIFPGLASLMEADGFSETVSEYLAAVKPSAKSITDEGRAFSAFLASGKFSYDFGVPPALLAELTELEWQQVEVARMPVLSRPIAPSILAEVSEDKWSSLRLELCSAQKLIPLHWNLLPTWRELIHGGTPAIPEAGEYYALLARPRGIVMVETLSSTEAKIYQEWLSGETVGGGGEDSETRVTLFTRLLQLELISGIRFKHQ